MLEEVESLMGAWPPVMDRLFDGDAQKAISALEVVRDVAERVRAQHR